MYGQSASRLTLTLNSSTLEYKIQGLSSLTTYTIDVAAVTAAGAGVPTSSTISSGVPPGQYAQPAVPAAVLPGPRSRSKSVGIFVQKSLGAFERGESALGWDGRGSVNYCS